MSTLALRTKKVLFNFLLTLILLGVFVFGSLFLFVRNSSNIRMEYVEFSEAAQVYKDKFDDTKAALSATHDSLTLIRNKLNVSKRKIDSITRSNDLIIKKFKYEKKLLLDSINTNRYKPKSFSPD